MMKAKHAGSFTPHIHILTFVPLNAFKSTHSFATFRSSLCVWRAGIQPSWRTPVCKSLRTLLHKGLYRLSRDSWLILLLHASLHSLVVPGVFFVVIVVYCFSGLSGSFSKRSKDVCTFV